MQGKNLMWIAAALAITTGGGEAQDIGQASRIRHMNQCPMSCSPR